MQGYRHYTNLRNTPHLQLRVDLHRMTRLSFSALSTLQECGQLVADVLPDALDLAGGALGNVLHLPPVAQAHRLIFVANHNTRILQVRTEAALEAITELVHLEDVRLARNPATLARAQRPS